MENQDKQTSNQQPAPVPASPAPAVAAATATSGEKPWYKKTWGTITLIVIGAILGAGIGAVVLYLVWVKSNWSTAKKWVVTIISFIGIAILQMLL